MPGPEKAASPARTLLPSTLIFRPAGSESTQTGRSPLSGPSSAKRSSTKWSPVGRSRCGPETTTRGRWP